MCVCARACLHVLWFQVDVQSQSVSRPVALLPPWSVQFSQGRPPGLRHDCRHIDIWRRDGPGLSTRSASVLSLVITAFTSTCLDFLSWRAVRNFYPLNMLMVLLGSSLYNRMLRRRGWLFRWLRMRLCGTCVSPVMRTSPSTCRVLAIDWYVLGLCRCLWLTHVVRVWLNSAPQCVRPCATIPRGYYFPPDTGSEVWIFGFYPNKQTNKQTTSVTVWKIKISAFVCKRGGRIVIEVWVVCVYVCV